MASIKTYPEKTESMVFGRNPWVWWGTANRDGDAGLWKEAPCGSEYTYVNSITAAVHYVKIANVPEDNDWANTID